MVNRYSLILIHQMVALVRRALVEVCTVPVLLVQHCTVKMCVLDYCLILVHGQVTIIFVVSVGFSVCLFVESFSQPSLIQFRSN